MSEIKFENGFSSNIEEPLRIDFSKIVVPESNFSTETPISNGIVTNISEGRVNFGSISTAYEKEATAINTTPSYVVKDNITYLNTATSYGQEYKTSGNVFANTPATNKTSITELQRVVQKLDKLEKMINPNSKKSLILWEEDNSFKNLISSIVSYSNNCDTASEFPIELYDKLKALGEDVNNQIIEGKAKVEDLSAQAKTNVELSEILSNAYISATAGLSSEEYCANLTSPELEEYKEYLECIATSSPESDEYKKAEKAIKSKITNLENCVHVTIDLERTTSKNGALEYIKKEITPAIERLSSAYEAQYNVATPTTIDGEEAITALAVKKSFVEKVYDTFVRPIANLFKRKNKIK